MTIKRSTNSLLLQLVWLYFSIYNIQADECPQPCTCQGNNNLTVNCSDLHLVNLPMTSASTLTLDLSHNSLGPIINASFVQMRNLTIIDLSQNGLTRLLGCTFNGMLELRTVRLRSNSLTALPDSLFTDSNKVEHLDISYNFFTELPDDVFRHIPALKFLDVSHNLIVQLKFGARFQILRHLQTINLSHNRMEAVNRDSFEMTSNWGVETHRSINLAYCRLSSIEGEAFSAIPKLHELDLSGNSALSVESLATLVKDLEAKGLERLSLAHMNLTTIVPLFNEVSELSLKFFNVSFNSITELPANVFSKVRSLQALDMSRNSVSTLAEGLSDLANLNILNISYNNVEAFHGEVSHLSSLKVLDLSHNKLGDPNRVNFSSLSNLNYLNVNNNLLTSTVLPDSTSNLQYLDYHSNRITEFRCLDDATLLEFVDFSNNKLLSLPGLLFKGAKFLKLVNFSRNNIATLDHGAFLPQSPIVIDLSYNFLRELHYSNWIATQQLYINNNELANIDNQAFYGMTGLERLDLSQNKLTTLHEDLFQYLAALKHLNLSRNGLNNLQWFSLFRSLELLVNLDLGYNNISYLNESMFLPLPNVHTVSLQSNRLRNIIPRTFRNLNEIKHIDLSNNPFDCSCDNVQFRDWLKKTQLPILGLYDMNSTAYHCRTPHERAGIHVTQWREEEFECDKSMLYVIVFCSTFIFLTVIGLVTTAAYRYFRRWRSRKEEIRKAKELEEERSKPSKKVDFVRLKDQKLATDLNERSVEQGHGKYQGTDRRNGYVPWPGNTKTQHERERSRNRRQKEAESTRDIGEDKTIKTDSERNGETHYERLKRNEWTIDELDKRRRRENDVNKNAETHDSGIRRERNTERPIRRRENDDTKCQSSNKMSLHDGFTGEARMGRSFAHERDQQIRGGPYIISSANTLPHRWDRAHDWGTPRGWNDQGYRNPRSHSQWVDSYMTMPVGDREMARHDREITARERASDYTLDRYPLEVHFDDEMEPKYYIRPRGDNHEARHYYHKRAQSYHYLPHDYADEQRHQREYESIEQARRDTGIGHRASSQTYISNDGTSDWL